MCLHNDASKNTEPFACLPKSWANNSDWTEILDLLRNKEQNIKAEAISTFDNVQVDPPTPEINVEAPATPTLLNINAEAISTSDNVQVHPPAPEINLEAPATPTLLNIKAEAISTFDNVQVHPRVPEISLEAPAMPTILIDPPSRSHTVTTLASPNTEGVREVLNNGPAVANVLPPEAIEFDLLDCDSIPALIAGVRRGTNVKEFLERLGVLTCTGMCSDFICTYCRFFFTTCSRKRPGNNSSQQPILCDASTSL